MHVLMAHGALGSAAQLEPVRQRLARDCDVDVMELEGHGSTAAAGDSYSLKRFAEAIRARLRERTIVFGYSMGGYAALMLAAERPEGMHGVVTLGTKLAWTPEVAAKEVARLDPGTIRAKVPRFAAQLEERHVGAAGWEGVLRKTAALMTELGSSPAVNTQILAKIAVPVRLMVGDRDTLVSVSETADAARQIPQGQLAVLPNTPHPIEQVRLDLLAAQLTDFSR